MIDLAPAPRVLRPTGLAPADLRVNSFHLQGIGRDMVGPGLRITAVSPDGCVEGIESEDGLLHGIQVILLTAPAVSNAGEGYPLGPRAGCFLAPGSGLGPVGTASARW